MLKTLTNMAKSKWYLTLFLIAVLVTGCDPLKDVSRQSLKEQFKVNQSTTEWKRQQGEVIILPAPRTPNKVFRDTIIKIVTKKGATIATAYDTQGEINSQIVICPDSEETKQTDTKARYSLQEKQVEKQMNIDAINAAGKWAAVILIPGQLFFALAWYFKSR